MNRLLNAALAYAERRWRVFPLAPYAKVPAIPKGAPKALRAGWETGGNGCHDATTDRGQIVDWWRRCPHANIGIATGRASGILVIDIDGREAAADFRSRFRIGQPLIQTTPRGWHLFYAWSPACEGLTISAGLLGKNIDTRGEGGYIVGAPSARLEGIYQWVDYGPLSPPPAEITAACKRPKPAKPATSEPINDNPGADTRYGCAALEAECEAIVSAFDGAQERQLNGSAFKIGGLVAGGELSRSTARARLIAAGMGMASHRARDPWTAAVVAAKVDGALAAGMGSPRRAAPRRIGGRS